MAHWCLRDVNYDALDFLTKTSLESKYPSLSRAPGYLMERTRSIGDNGRNKGEFLFKLPRRTPGDKLVPDSPSKYNGHPDVVLVENLGAKASVCIRDAADHWAPAKLRDAMLTKARHSEIPQCIATWPLETLRLQEILAPEECDCVFSSPDALWTLVFQGLVLLSPLASLTHLDLTGYVPSRGLLFTILQLVPLLTLPMDNLDTIVIRDTVMSTLKLDTQEEADLLSNLTTFLDTQLKHKIFQRGRRIHLPGGHLKVSLDFLPMSVTRLSFMGLLVARGLEPRSRVTVLPHSIVFRYATTSSTAQGTLDPLFCLRILDQILSSDRLEGLVLECIPLSAIPSVFTLLHRTQHRLHRLHKFGFTHSPLDLTDPSCKKQLISLLTNFTRLKRLDFTGSRIEGELECVLRVLTRPLDYLNLSHCSLNLVDVDAIMTSAVTSGLRDLDLSYVYTSACVECLGRFDAVIHCLDVSSGISQRDSGYYSQSRDSSRVSSPTADSPAEQVDDTNMWSFWKLVSERSASELVSPSKHIVDQNLLNHIVKNLTCLQYLTIAEINAISFEFRVPHNLLLEVAAGMKQLTRLKHLAMEDIPMWDEDIYQLVEAAVAMPMMQSLALTRSHDAPKMKTQEKIAFWKRIYEIREQKVVRMSVGGFVDVETMC